MATSYYSILEARQNAAEGHPSRLEFHRALSERAGACSLAGVATFDMLAIGKFSPQPCRLLKGRSGEVLNH